MGKARSTTLAVIVALLLSFLGMDESALLRNYELLNYTDTSRLQKQGSKFFNSKTVFRYDRTFTIETRSRKLRLCLIEDKTVLSKDLYSNSGNTFEKIKLYKGSVCGKSGSSVLGAIIAGVFYGRIEQGRGRCRFFDDISRFPKLKKACSDCHSVMYFYSSFDQEALRKLLLHSSCHKTPSPHNSTERTKALNDSSGRNDTANSTDASKVKVKSFSHVFCDLAIYIHQSYLDGFTSIVSCVAIISVHILAVNNALIKQISINGFPRILYQIRNVTVVGRDHLLHKSSGDPELLIRNFGEFVQSLPTSCLNGMYVGKNWDGVLGLAYVGDDSGVGICNNDAVYAITSVSMRETLPMFTHLGTTIHEIGHTLGSIHDPIKDCAHGCYPSSRMRQCSPGAGRNYIMYPYAVDGEFAQNFYFSQCSVQSIKELVLLPTRTNCLKKYSSRQ